MPSLKLEISPSGYTFHHQPRSVGRGGGVGILLSDHIPDYSTFESINAVEISASSFSAYFVCLYRPPRQPTNFFEEFQDLLEQLATLHSDFYIFYFNLNLDKRTAIAITFDYIITPFDLKQHVTFSTHIHGHRLDLVITRST